MLQLFSRVVYWLLGLGPLILCYLICGWVFLFLVWSVFQIFFLISNLLGDSMIAKRVYRGMLYLLVVKGTLVDLFMDMVDFHDILGMDYFHSCKLSLDSRTHMVVFRLPSKSFIG